MNTKKIPVTLTDVAEALSRELIINGKDRTATLYRCAARCLIRFAGDENLLLTGITPALLYRYDACLALLGRKPNTIAFHMRNLRAMYNKAAHRGMVEPPPAGLFSGVHTGVYPTVKRALNNEDMCTLSQLALEPPVAPAAPGSEAITAPATKPVPAAATGEPQKKPPLPPKLYRSLLLFLFSFLACGIAFIDLAFMKKSNIRDGRIYYYRKKTGKYMSFKITAQMQWIINYFASMVADSPFLFPVLNPNKGDLLKQYRSALATHNRRLRILGQLAGISQRLTSHVARHSWATIAKKKNVSLSMICECLGHQDEKTTAFYLDSFSTSRMDEVSELIAATICF